jgi:hypothetical protein
MLRKLSILSLVALVAAACSDSTKPTLHLIQNGGFETGTFAGWTVFDAAGGDTVGFVVYSDTTTPVFDLTVLAPPESLYAAITDQGGPGTHILYQDVVLPANRTATLRATIYLRNDAADYANAPTVGLAWDTEDNQQFRVDVMNPAAAVTDVGTGVLLNVYRTQPGDSLSTGYRALTADLTAFAGQTVRIRFAEVDNQGNLNVGVDAVDVEIKD